MTVFSVEDAQTLINRLKEIFDMIKTNNGDMAKKIALMKNIDDEEKEYLWEDIEKVDKGIHHIMEISGFLINNMGASISSHIGATLMPSYAQVLLNIKGKKDYELIDSVCFICDCMEHGDDALFNQI